MAGFNEPLWKSTTLPIINNQTFAKNHSSAYSMLTLTMSKTAANIITAQFMSVK